MTIKELSKVLSISPGTIDRVIHNRGRVSKETEEKVKAGLKKYGYTVNPTGSALANFKKERSVAIICNANNSYFSNILQKGFHDNYPLLKNLGITIYELNYTDREENEICKNIEKAIYLNVNAIVIHSISSPKISSLLKKAKNQGCIIVALNIQQPKECCHVFVGHDNFSSGRTAMQMLLQQLPEHSNIVLFSGMQDENSHITRTNGALSYLLDSNKQCHLLGNLLIDYRQSEENIYKSFNNVFTQKSVDGILILPLFQYSISELIKFTCCQNIVIGAYDLTHKNITRLNNGTISFIIEQNPYRQAKKSLEILYDHFIYNHIDFTDFHTDCTIITRENLNTYLENHNYIPF